MKMPRRGENIHKRKDGRWEGRYISHRNKSGKSHYVSVYAKTYKEAKIKMREAQVHLQERQDNTITKRCTFEQVLTMWLNNNRLTLKGATIHKYQYLIDAHILPELGEIVVSELTSSSINLFLDHKMKEGRLDKTGGLSSAYVRSIVIIITSALQFAVNEKLCLPFNTEIQKPCLLKQELVILTVQEQLQLETYLLQHLTFTSLGILISLNTGLRIGEVCALCWDNIDLCQGLIHVCTTTAKVLDEISGRKSKWIIDEPKTVSSKRVIPISNKLLKELTNMKSIHQSPFVISETRQFMNPRTYEYRFHKILEKAGIRRINYHALRHTFATRCIEAGVDVKSLSEILGHANVGITLNTYVHSSLDLKREQLEKVSAFINT